QSVDGDDVRMLQRAGGARLAHEAIARVGRTPRARQQLERHEASNDGVVCLPVGAHRPFADELVQLELTDPSVLPRLRHSACVHRKLNNLGVLLPWGNGPSTKRISRTSRKSYPACPGSL